MIVKINTGKNVGGVVRYNENKVINGEARVIGIENFPVRNPETISVRSKINLLESQCRLNTNVTKPTLHIPIAFHPTENLSDEKLLTIANDYLSKLGYGDQPYLVYRHEDTHHPHIHIVTVNINFEGKRISDSNIKYRSNEIRKELEISNNLVKAEEQNKIVTISSTLPDKSITYGKQETKKAIGNVLQTAMKEYSFSRIEEFAQFVAAYNVQMNIVEARDKNSKKGISFQLTDGETPLSPSIKASSYSFTPTAEKLENRFRNGRQKKELNKPKLLEAVKKSLASYERISETDFKNALRESGIQIVDSGSNYLYIDHTKRAAYSEFELGNKFSRAYLQEHFVEESTLRKKVEEPKLSRIETEPQIPVYSEAQRKEFGKWVSKHYQDFKKEKGIFFESQLIKQFPFKFLVSKLQNEGKPISLAEAAVREFESYKAGKLTEVISSEIAYFERNTKPYLILASQMPISTESRIQFLDKLNLKLEKEVTGEYSLVHKEGAEFRYTLSQQEHQKLLNGTSTSIPFTQPFTKAEKVVYLAAATGQRQDQIAHSSVRTAQLRASLSEPDFERISHDLNRNSLQEVAVKLSSNLSEVIDQFYPRGLVVTQEGAQFKAGFYNTPVSSFQPVAPALQTYLEKNGLPNDYLDMVGKLATAEGRFLVQYTQGIDTGSTARKSFVEQRVNTLHPDLKGMTGTVLSNALYTKLKEATPLPKKATILLGGYSIQSKADKEKAAKINKVIFRDYFNYRISSGYYYESSLLKKPEEFPTTRLVNTLSNPPHSLSRLDAESAVQKFKEQRLSQLPKIKQKDMTHFMKSSQGFHKMVSEANLSLKHRLGSLNAAYFKFYKLPDGGYEISHQSDRAFKSRLSREQVEELFATPQQPERISIPSKEFPRYERKLYEIMAMGGELSKNPEDTKPITFFNIESERTKILLTPKQWDDASPWVNQATIKEALQKAPIDQYEKVSWFHKRGILMEPTGDGFRLGFHLTNTQSFVEAPKSLNPLLVNVGMNSTVFQLQQQGLNTERGKAMIKLASAIDSGNDKRIEFAVQAIVTRASDLKPYASDPERLLDAISKTYGPLAVPKNYESVIQDVDTVGSKAILDDNTDNLSNAMKGLDVSPEEGKKKKGVGQPTGRRPKLRR